VGKPEAILFDFGGTLDVPRHWLDRFLEHYRTAGIKISMTELLPAYDAALGAAYRAPVALMAQLGLRELIGMLVGLQIEHLSGSRSQAAHALLTVESSLERKQLADEITGHFFRESCGGLARSRRVLQELSRNFRLGVVSNFYGNLDKVLAEFGLAPLLSVTIDSALVGVAKPDPRIFSAALDRLNIEPHLTVMVGDSVDKDCEPARAIGLRTVWLNTASSAEGPPFFGSNGSRPFDHAISALEELTDLAW
jgi:FMN phosphatase YigB (HAD superfamily)